MGKVFSSRFSGGCELQLDIDKIYGVHYSRCHGLTIGLDILLPPKKCPLDCKWCPIGKTVVKTRNLVEIDMRVIDELESIKELLNKQGLQLKNLYIWGFGDPLLNNRIISIIKDLKEEKMIENIIVHTSGLLFPKYYTTRLFDFVDEFVIPFAWTSEGEIEIEWKNSISLSTFLDIISDLSKKYPERVSLEITVFKLAGMTNPSIYEMNEIGSYMLKARPSRIYLKTVNRPVGERTRSVTLKVLEEYASLLENLGLKTVICEDKLDTALNIQIPNLIRLLYNHILRKPLSHEEVKSIYGEKGVISAENLVAMGRAIKQTWEKKVYYRGVV